MDKRKHPRIHKEFRVKAGIVTYPLERLPRERCQSKDIGEGGICFVSPVPFSTSALVDISIHIAGWQLHKKPFSYFVDLSSEKPLTVLGRVVWCGSQTGDTNHEIGIEFLDICDDDRVALARYLNNRS